MSSAADASSPIVPTAVGQLKALGVALFGLFAAAAISIPPVQWFASASGAGRVLYGGVALFALGLAAILGGAGVAALVSRIGAAYRAWFDGSIPAAAAPPGTLVIGQPR